MNEYPPAGFQAPMPQPTTATKGGKGSKREKKAPTRRVLSTQRKLFLAFAVVAALLVVVYVMKPAETTYIARMTVSVPALTEVAPAQIEAVQVDPKSVETGGISGSDGKAVIAAATEMITGKRTLVPVFAGQQLRPELFSAGVALNPPLAPTERLLSIGARAAGSVAGTIVPGDRVDVYAADSDGLAGLLAKDVEVVAVTVRPDQLDSASSAQLSDPTKTMSDLVPANPIPGTYIIRIPGDAVPGFIAADSKGTIYLALRGAGATDNAGIPTDVKTALCTNAPENILCTSTGQ